LFNQKLMGWWKKNKIGLSFLGFLVLGVFV